MAQITLEHITKKFKDVVALKDVNLVIEDNEFYVIFGPAGAGKTTILNIISGICDPDEGRIKFGDRSMAFIESGERNISMVFENYALYPNMTAYDNIASPFRSKKFRKSPQEIDVAVKKVAAKLNIMELLDRLPSQMSNGQRQRVALGRALVRDPNAFLLDEPIAHLDAKLRNAMRKELKTMQADLGATTIYVTHDYVEALSLADRIAVINLGEIQQIGTPYEVFYTPKNEFVAKLFGEPEINLMRCVYHDGRVALPWQEKSFIPVPFVKEKLDAWGKESVDIGLRSSNMFYTAERKSDDQVEGKVYTMEPIGNSTELVISVEDALIRFVIPVSTKLDLDQTVYIGFDYMNALFFDAETTDYIVRYGEDQLKRGEIVG